MITQKCAVSTGSTTRSFIAMLSSVDNKMQYCYIYQVDKVICITLMASPVGISTSDKHSADLLLSSVDSYSIIVYLFIYFFFLFLFLQYSTITVIFSAWTPQAGVKC